MNNLTKRIVSGIIYIILVMGSILYGALTFFSIFLFLQILCQSEFYSLSEKNHITPNKFSGIFSGVLFFISSALSAGGRADINIYFFPFLILYLAFIQSLYSKASEPFTNISFTVLGIFYCSIPFASLNYMAFYPSHTFSPHIVMGYIILLWTYDSGAYLTGSVFGRHKLFERVSPGKTWEGFIGGAMICLIVSRLLPVFFNELTAGSWMFIALIIITAGTYGDLSKSLLKRSAGVKDSGNIMPGHGGMLDRMDSFLFSALFVMSYLLLIKHSI